MARPASRDRMRNKTNKVFKTAAACAASITLTNMYVVVLECSDIPVQLESTCRYCSLFPFETFKFLNNLIKKILARDSGLSSELHTFFCEIRVLKT